MTDPFPHSLPVRRFTLFGVLYILPTDTTLSVDMPLSVSIPSGIVGAVPMATLSVMVSLYHSHFPEKRVWQRMDYPISAKNPPAEWLTDRPDPQIAAMWFQERLGYLRPKIHNIIFEAFFSEEISAEPITEIMPTEI